MSDTNVEQFEEFVTEDGPGSADADATPVERERPEEQAHGGSMAPGMVAGDGRPVADPPPGTPED